MAHYVNLTNLRNKTTLKLEMADTFFSRFRGLMFRRFLEPNTGIILSESSESIINSSIHMFFMRFNIGVLWLDRNYVIVDKCLAKKWYPFYFSKKPAKHVIEIHASSLDYFLIGDKLEVSEI